MVKVLVASLSPYTCNTSVLLSKTAGRPLPRPHPLVVALVAAASHGGSALVVALRCIKVVRDGDTLGEPFLLLEPCLDPCLEVRLEPWRRKVEDSP